MFFRRLFNRGNSDETKRTVFIGSHAQLHKKKKFCSNSIDTSKYNLFTFIFKFLFEQFQKYSNIFFLCISLLDQIPSVSPTGRFTTLTPFLIILAVSAVKEIIEDISRKRSDILINNKKTKVLKENGWKDEKWMNIKVGDIVRVESEQLFPADLFFLSSSEPNSICFLETANLDGETNLKIRQSLKDTSHLTTMESLRDDFNVELEYEQPNRNLYEFAGNLKMDRNKIVPIGPNQILLRGSRLCNTHWIYGVVIYTGHETKLMMNSNKASLKRSQIDKKTNYQIFFLFMILVVIALMSAVLAEFWNRNQSPNHWYLGFEDDRDKFLYNFVTFILLYNNLIPISLSVTLEMVRFLQAFFINWDLEMYDEENDFFANARTSNLNEELGLVKYVFSDKTGTLTRNQMELKGCSIAGTSYGTHSHARADWNDLIDGLSGPDGTFIDEFLTLLSTCHTIIPEKNELDLYETKYQAASPDENAFVVQIKNMGIIFHTRLYDKLIIRYLNEDREYEILNVLEFNSVRKRMSVIIRDQNGVIKLYCKGADNVILARLSNRGQQFKDITLTHLEEFASEGLRTLVLAYKVISEAKYQEWNEIYKAAATSLDKRDEKIQAAAELIEKNLTVLGATAVEDKLQEGVPETIEKLKLAGINVWVLTGDKLETAVNIGFSCRLLNDETKLIYLIDDNDETDETLMKWFNYFNNPRREENGTRFGLIIEGKAIESLLSDKWSEKFFKIATSCNVVICCRATPKNKAEVVELIKYRTRDITLAIGDGANDVSMIRAAHVGIGICGREGTQALSASDYAIGQFRFLERLLFVHGTWNYKRVAKVILYSFYKNVCLYLIELWFALFNGFSGQILFDRWLIGLYNVIFTAIPPLALGLFDRPTKASTMIRFPELYSVEAKQVDFNMITFWASIANSVLHSAMLYFSSYAILHTEVAFSDGKIGDYIYMGNFVFTFCVIVVCLKAGLETDSWTIMSHISIWGSILAWILFLTIYSYAWPTFDVGIEMTRMVENVFRSGLFWMSLILVPVLILIIDVTVKTVQQTFFKTLFQKVRETEATDDEYSSNLFAFVSRNYSKKPMQIIRKLTIPIRYLGFAFSQEENGPVNQAEMVVRI